MTIPQINIYTKAWENSVDKKKNEVSDIDMFNLANDVKKIKVSRKDRGK